MRIETKRIAVLFRCPVMCLLFCAVLAGPARFITDIRGAKQPPQSVAFPFEENRGQVARSDVKYFARSVAGTVFLTDRGEIVYSFASSEPVNGRLQPAAGIPSRTRPVKGWALKESFVGSLDPRIEGEDRSDSKISYFKGDDRSSWRCGVAAYHGVSLGEIYRGIRFDIRVRGNNVEKLFRLTPGGNPADIKLQVQGGNGLKSNAAGELEIATGVGAFRFTRPTGYQLVDGRRQEVAVDYTVGEDTYGFKVGPYDPDRELVIDPLLASTFLGGSDQEGALSVAVDGNGGVYVGGYTYSTDFPKTLGAYFTGTATSSQPDGFIAKFDSGLTELMSCTIFGGSGADSVSGLYVYRDSTTSVDYVYATGRTASSNFPTTAGAYDVTFNALPPGSTNDVWYRNDAFVVKFDSSLQHLLASTFLGNVQHDEGTAIAVTRDGNVYVTGLSNSDWTYGVAFSFGGYWATGFETVGWVAELDSALAKLLGAAMIYGGHSNAINDPTTGLQPYALSIRRTVVNNETVEYVYVAGETWLDTNGYFPTTTNGYQRTFKGGGLEGDAFVLKFNSKLTVLLAGTYLGGTGNDMGMSLAVHSDGTVYVAGITYSTDFPTTSGAYQASGNNIQDAAGMGDAFVSRFDENLHTLMASTYLGGSSADGAFGLALDRCGNVYLTGQTFSGGLPGSSTAFPTTSGAPDRTYDGSGDAFLSMLEPALKTLFFSTFVGLEKSEGSSVPEYKPTGKDVARAIALDNVRSAVFIVGTTWSGTVGVSPVKVYPSLSYNMFPVLPIPPQGYTDPKAFDISYNGAGDAFASKYGMLVCGWCRSYLVWRNALSGQTILWYLDVGTYGSFAYLSPNITDPNWKIAGSGDFDGDGSFDLLWRNYATGDNVVWFMQESTLKSWAHVLTIPDTRWQIAGVGDFNHDGMPDILWRHNTTGQAVIWLMNHTTLSSWGEVEPRITDLNWKIAGIGDFNKDGPTDILWRNAASGAMLVWVMNGAKLVTQLPVTPSLSDTMWQVSGIGDFDCDGNADILWRNSNSGSVIIWTMSQSAMASYAFLNPMIGDANWKIVAAPPSGY
jgi:hypothetical protein